ncbi:MAG: NADH-quinone oxidoreductase subunit D [Cytophagales bacterium]|nr:NADH-quinone oxidoreductase subunit D [Bernardetiaceae bacterium]MDW8210094.1 NADH-quinone oxidoreductase subunit D [Cytophagales bacterium]
MPAITYDLAEDNLRKSEPSKYNPEELPSGCFIINLGPQHPSTHGVLRLEVLTDGETVLDVVPHIGYLHRCFEKHAENLPYNQIIPFVDRLDYLAAMNCEHAYVLAVEKLLELEGKLPKRVEYIRVLMAELNRLASHFVAIGTYAIDMGAFTPFLWMMRDREHILRMLEWATGARMLYNYIWIGGLYYDLPIGFEERCQELLQYLQPKLRECQHLLIENKIFIQRTAGIGVLPLETAIQYGVTGPMLRASGLKYDLRRVDGYSVYPELEFEVPIGQGLMGKQGDCWDRTYVRLLECKESVRIAQQCLAKLTKEHRRTRDFDPQAAVPKHLRTKQVKQVYGRAETPKGELGFFIRSQPNSDVPWRVKCRSCSFSNLSAIAAMARGGLLADLIAVLGSIDIVLGEIDR